MRVQIILTLSIVLFCDAKLPRTNHLTAPSATVSFNERRTVKTSEILSGYTKKTKRSVFDSKSYESSLIWTHSERLDDMGDVVLRWVNSDSSITFRVEARTKGYVGIGFGSEMSMKGADLVAAWVNDRNGIAHIQDCHGYSSDNIALLDEVQNYELISGYQNDTHTTIEFRRQLDTCDRHDYIIGDDTIQVLWALGSDSSDGELHKHARSGSRPLRLLQPVPKPESIPLEHWDVRLNNQRIPHNVATQFWCKIFKAPELNRKHHIVGYQPIIDSKPLVDDRLVNAATPSPVHHMVLYECADDPDKFWEEWADDDGFFGPNRPREWASCITPVAAWAMGSKGEFLPENVGIPLGERGGVSYYMLEVHYDNLALHEVLDNSGIRIHYTPVLRAHDAALLGSGIGVSALHVIPPRQRHYKTVGICSAECSNNTMPEEGINIVSVLLHAHGTARKIALKHVRGNEELPRISQENFYDSRYQQSRIVPGGRKFIRGDTLITECTYDSSSRDKPILGGFSSTQEMCLSFVLYYPRTELAGCYSMTPVKEFFETFGVREFYNIPMFQVENLFLSSGSLDNLTDFAMRYQNVEESVQGDDQGVALLKELIIKEPHEFRNKSFIEHINEMPWTEPLLTKEIEKILYKGTHMTFCKRKDDTWGAPVEIQNFPNYIELQSNDTAEKACQHKSIRLPSVTINKSNTILPNLFIYFNCLFILKFIAR